MQGEYLWVLIYALTDVEVTDEFILVFLQPDNISFYTAQLYILYVQEVVTLQKKYSNMFASEN